MPETSQVHIIAPNGQNPFRCESRAKLFADSASQSGLRIWWRSVQDEARRSRSMDPITCGCCHERKLRIAVAEVDGMIFPRAWPGEQKLHPDWCQTVGNGTSGKVQGRAGKETPRPLTWHFERAMDVAYLRQLSCSEPSHARFCLDLEDALRAGLAGDSQFAGLRCGVGFAENTPVSDDAVLHGDFALPVRMFRADGTQHEKVWRGPLGTPFGMRTDPRGCALPGLYVAAAVRPEAKPISAMHAWPVHAGPAMIHARASSLEELLLGQLEQHGVAFVKPPSEHFMGMCNHPDWAELFALLAAAHIWPDVTAKLGEARCVLEVAGKEDPGYLADLALKVTKFLRLERVKGLEWAVIKPLGDRLVVAARSRKLAVADLLNG
jgi:hypothetical protein